MNIDLPIRAKGRFKLIRHTGHVFDENGRLVKMGDVIDETPFADNLFTYYGSAFYLNKGDHEISVAVSSSSVPPTMKGPGVNTTAVVGRSSATLLESVTSRSGLPDSDGNLYWRTTYRFTFPQMVGGGIATFRQASTSVQSTEPIFVPLGSGAIPVTGGPISAAMLDSPFTVDMATEDFDLVWEFTEILNVEKAGVALVPVVDAFGVIKSTSEHTYRIRPANFFNTDNDHAGWNEMTGREFPKTTTLPWSFQCGVGVIGDYASQPVFSETINVEAAGISAPWLGGTSCAVSLTYGLTDTTPSETINCVRLLVDHTDWQIDFDPPISKKARHRFLFNFNLSIVDRSV